MKKFYLSLILAASLPFGAAADVLLDEGFEDNNFGSEDVYYSRTFPDGWETIDSYLGNTIEYNWHIYYSSRSNLSGMYCASVDATMFDDDGDGYGPRTEYLLTPELDLQGTYQLSFLWEGTVAAIRDNEYDFQVRVVEDGQDVATVEPLWSFLDPDDLRNSGVLDYPWTGFQAYASTLDLSAWQGKKVRIAFVYDMIEPTANVVHLDNIKVESFSPITQPQPELSFNRYNFGNVYMGAKKYSDVITMTNVGTDGMQITDIELPEGVTTTLDKSIVLNKNEKVEFQVAYMATLTSPIDGNVVIKTNGGDVELRVIATKVAVPSGSTLECFEQRVPPAGWSGNGWSQTAYALEGDYSAYASVSLEGASYLVSPRLDLSDGEKSVSFTYYNQFEGEYETSAAENDVELQLSTNGNGEDANWTTVWTAPYEYTECNIVTDETIDLGAPASDNCYLRWVYAAVEYDSEYVPETSLFFLDQVILPNIYGMDGVPVAGGLISPADGTVNVYNKNVVLEWEPAMLATGYKLYVGSDAAATNLINGQDLGNVTTYTIPSVAYATTYNWKVVPYNDKGDAENVAVWTFTTIPDCTVSEFPYSEGFEGETFPALGWNVEAEGYTKWDTNTVNPYEGKKSLSAHCNMAASSTILTTPDFVLPAEPVQISFYWGNDMPVSLKKDDTGLVKNTTTEDDGLDACYFEILADGEWKQLAIISDKDNEYWCRERVNLAEYAGKTVSFRWRYVGHDYDKAQGAALDMVNIDYVAEKKASFNLPEWNAGKVNYMQSVSSGNIFTVLNDGEGALKVTSVEFDTENFTSTLAAGTTINSQEGVAFSLTFNAKDTNSAVEDEMTVNFEGGYSISLPLSGVALGSDTKYYDFEQDEAGSKSPIDFTTIDVDNAATIDFLFVDNPGIGDKYAFLVVDNALWNNYLDPVSGTHILFASGTDSGAASDDWIISKKMKATANAKFSFYAHNYETQGSADAGYPATQSTVEVLVSTTGNSDTSDFETVMDQTVLPYYIKGDKEQGWQFFEVDLGKYAGQDIYVAVRHYVMQDGMGAVFDDFTFSGFEGLGGVGSLESDGNVRVYPNPATDVVYIDGVENADVTLTSLSGAVVLDVDGVKTVDVSGLSAGVYLMTVKTGNGVYTERIIKK